MREMLMVLGLGAAVWAAPRVDVPANTGITPAPVQISVLESATPWAGPVNLIPAGGDSLIFPVPPRIGNGPILPDLPWPLPDAAPDAPPLRGSQPPAGLILDTVDFLSTDTPAATPNHRRVTAVSLNLRSGPAKRFRAVTSLRSGDIAVVTGAVRNGWVPVRVKQSGKRGWVFSRFLAPIRG